MAKLLPYPPEVNGSSLAMRRENGGKRFYGKNP
jgi:hypothetical protein